MVRTFSTRSLPSVKIMRGVNQIVFSRSSLKEKLFESTSVETVTIEDTRLRTGCVWPANVTVKFHQNDSRMRWLQMPRIRHMSTVRTAQTTSSGVTVNTDGAN